VSVRTEVLRFLRDPDDFIQGAAEPDMWIEGLEGFVVPSVSASDEHGLRPAQEAAWRGLANKRAGLVLGPPGTGKTHLLSWMIAGFIATRRRVGMPARVLVTAFTRNAIGNVIDAAAARQSAHDPDGAAPLFFGDPPEAGLSPNVEVLNRREGQKLIERLNSGHCAVGMTVWSLYRFLAEAGVPEGDGRTAPLFDLVCIDEASQLVLGHGLMALAGLAPSGRIVVAGDDRQLPPIRAGRPVRIEERELGGSLYTFLKSVGAPEFALDETFRLNEPLTSFPERSFYQGRFVSRANRALQLKDGWQADLDSFSRAILDPDWPVVVVLHDGGTASTVNPFEVGLATRLAGELAERLPVTDASALWSEHLAIITPHRAQNAAIRAALPETIRDGAFVETVDRIQGKERNAVVLSYCVSDPEFALAEGEFIFSSERLNVAITRARTKLIVLISRRLLEAVPAEQELLDKAELLREFVFSCQSIGATNLEGQGGQPVHVEIRGRNFDGRAADVDLAAAPKQKPATVDLSPRHLGILEIIRALAAASPYGSAKLSDVRKRMALADEPWIETAALHMAGWVSLQCRVGRYGDFWTVRPFSSPRRVYEADEDTVRQRIESVVREARQGRHAFYDQVRDRFQWMDSERRDVLRPVLEGLEAEGVVRIGATNGHAWVEIQRPSNPPVDEGLPPAAILSDADFELLNQLEELECRRINFGIFDGWTSSVEIAGLTSMPLAEVTLALSRLADQGHLMLAEEGRVRSRTAELARELRHLKQRFREDDAHRRPYLVRNLKVELRDRMKPQRNLPLDEAFDPARTQTTDSQNKALDHIASSLRDLWGDGAKLARFQAHGLEAILGAWNGGGSSCIAIAADTGSGKTEAAALPLIAAALADKMEGVFGTRAVLAYPRVRLAANQAQRLASYLAALANNKELPQLTIGLQVAEVPQSFESLPERLAEIWPSAGPDRFAFPFFTCPPCGGPLALMPNAGRDGADSLRCADCGWHFDGWVGTKASLRTQPPSLFLPTTESLHQWMHDPNAGRLFGDDPDWAPPRALLADEIHLYTHVHGAQVGLALQRLAARTRLNDQDDRELVAIGMSATIGDPALAWSRLIGRNNAKVIEPSAEDRVRNPRGREVFYFLQPEIESRGADIAGASTTIQALMCLSHGVRRRTGTEGGFRSLVFFDSIDKMRRLHGAYLDAEEGKELASLRTRLFGDDPSGSAQTECCGEPLGCDRHADGECWWFASSDRRQVGAQGLRRPGQPLRVAERPIFAGTRGVAEKIVKDADVVFATSSLEVGYDDPDITLVYQHYAPLNLASFVQRKGRGGRGADDRPTTGVTLSIYSPRDAWWFRRPEAMISPHSFDAPLNPDNAFVRRGHAVAAMFDALAQMERKRELAFRTMRDVDDSALEETRTFIESVLGADVWDHLEIAGPNDLWHAATEGRDLADYTSLPKLRQSLDWVPNALFETVNLPSVGVRASGAELSRYEDASHILHVLAPGNASRRFDARAVHWRPPSSGRSPWFAVDDYREAEAVPLRATSQAVLAELPLDVREELQGLAPHLCRPRQVTVERIGRMAGADWTPEVGHRAGDPSAFGPMQADSVGVGHDSRGELRGFLLVAADPEKAESLPSQCISSIASGVKLHKSGLSRARASGLEVARVFWGADSEVRFSDRQSEPLALSQTFVGPRSGTPLLHGYQVSTEGLQFNIALDRLDTKVEEIENVMATDEGERRWRTAQFTRYLVESGARALGVNAFEARRGANLIVAAAGSTALREDLKKLLRFWDSTKFATLLERTRSEVLSQDPTLTERRVARTAEALASDSFRTLLQSALNTVRDEARLRDYLRSTILHGLSLRLRSWVALVGRGDEGRLFTHVQLPLQFGSVVDDVITVAEAGAHGDGTIRAVADNWEATADSGMIAFLRSCPNAEEDAVMRQFWKLSKHHDEWRECDPRSARNLREISALLRPDNPSASLPASVLRVLFGTESIGADSFAMYDIAADTERVRVDLKAKTEREPSEWEFASAAVRAAEDGEVPELARLLSAYTSLDEKDEEAFSPSTRLADQVLRLSAPLCSDGCRACVHQRSDLMGEGPMQSSTSRTLLERFVPSD